jgi:ribonuclease HI
MPPTPITIYADGGCLGNPGLMFHAYVVLDRDMIWLNHVGHTEIGTNNQCEYVAIIKALEAFLDVEVTAGWHGTNVNLYSDSKLVINQIKGKNLVAAPHLQQLRFDAQKLILKLRERGWNIDFHWVSRTNPWIEVCDKMIKDAEHAYRQENGRST